MKTMAFRLSAGGLGALLTVLAPAVQAQLDRASIRGTVVDEQGQPLPGVQIELLFKGESRQKIVKKATTDKKGGYIYMGLLTGNWEIAFSKDGFKTSKLETQLSGGGVSEIPPITLLVTAAAPGVVAAAPAAPAGDASARASERGKELSESYQKALAALRAGQTAEAEAQLKAIVAEVPNLAEAHHNLGYLYTRRGDNAAAEASFRKAIELQPESSESYVALATLLGQEKRTEEALKLLQGAPPALAQDAKFQFALGAAAFNVGQSEAAEAAFIRVAELDPSNSEVHFFLGSLALNRNDIPAALQRLEKYVASAPPAASNLEAAKALIATLKKRK